MKKNMLLIFSTFGLITLFVGCAGVMSAVGLIPLKGALHFPSNNTNNSQVFNAAQSIVSSMGWQIKTSEMKSGLIHAVYRGSKSMSWTIDIGNWNEKSERLGLIITVTDPVPVIGKKQVIKFSKILVDTLSIKEQQAVLVFVGGENKPLSEYQ